VFLGTVAAGVLAAAGAVAGGAAYGGHLSPHAAKGTASATPPVPRRAVPRMQANPVAVPYYFPTPHLTKIPVPHGTVTGLPGKGTLVALTVDDGGSSEVVRLYTEFARKTGMRITFFLNGSLASWTENAEALRPLVQSGQVQLANHTWSHPNLKKLPDAGIAHELMRNDDFIQKTYGVDPKPYFRPPFGYHDERVDRVAAGLGYTTPTLWYGSLSDSGLITEQQLKGFADQWMLPQHIVIGHANFLPVTHCFDYLVELMRARSLQPVTLNDVFAR
jgi:peptidoglycan/xylan/chitin deacetylase (PgdA/CDA1 family)